MKIYYLNLKNIILDKKKSVCMNGIIQYVLFKVQNRQN